MQIVAFAKKRRDDLKATLCRGFAPRSRLAIRKTEEWALIKRTPTIRQIEAFLSGKILKLFF
jgi:hypothetical protein